MASEKYSFWDSFAEALEPLDDATYGRIVRGAKGGLKGGQRGAKAKGKDMRGNESIDSFSPLATHTYPAGAPPAPADAGPVAPARAPGREPWDVPDGEYPTPPDV